MHCPACRRTMLSTSSQVLEDERGAMTVTRWRCRPCRETTEEIRLSAGYRGPSPASIRYAVAGHRRIKSPTSSYGGSEGGAHGRAIACRCDPKSLA
jgi:transposase-like protein